MDRTKKGEAPNSPELPGPKPGANEPSNVRPSENPVPERKPEPSHLPGKTVDSSEREAQ